MRRTDQGKSTGQLLADARTIRHDARTTLRENLEPDARTSRVAVYNVNREHLFAVTVPLVPLIADPEVQQDEIDSDDPYYDVFAPSRVAARVSRPSISPSSTGLPDMGVRVLSGGAGGVAGSYSASHMGIPVSMMPPGNPMLMDADEYETWFGKCLSAAARISASTRLQTTSSPGPFYLNQALRRLRTPRRSLFSMMCRPTQTLSATEVFLATVLPPKSLPPVPLVYSV